MKNKRHFLTGLAVALAMAGCATRDHCMAPEFHASGDSGTRSQVYAASPPRSPAPRHDGETSSARLQRLAGPDAAFHAYVLVGGIHDTYDYFGLWADTLSAGGRAVFGWNHDHRSSPMAAAAGMLAEDLRILHRSGTGSITLIAHSIGGLVSKGAIDRLEAANDASRFQRLDLHAFGTPWGGFDALRWALSVPGSQMVSTLFGYPMSHELVPGSAYLASLRRAMPGHGKLHLYVGENDRIALPARSGARRRHARIEPYAASVTTIEKLRHNDYSRALSLVALAGNEAAGSACPDGPCRLALRGERCVAPFMAAARRR